MIGVGVPTLIACIFFGLLASDRYISEAEFVVRGVSSKRATGLEMFFQTFGVSRAMDDTNAVQNFILSRDAVRALEQKIPLREYFSNKKGDFFSRFPRFLRGAAFEDLYYYYQDRVSVIQDSSKGITNLRVVTFDPKEAQTLASTLLQMAEEMVNRMNARAQSDALNSLENERALAEAKLIETQRNLTEFRTREMLIDPAKNSSSVLDTITTLTTEMTRTMAQLAETARVSPSSPALPSLRAKIDSLRRSIEGERNSMTGDNTALASKVAEYEQLTLRRQMAERSLAGASTSLEIARQEARRQHIYLEQIVSPNLPDEAGEPERLRMIATIFVLSFAISAVIWILLAGAKEHAIE